MDEFVLLPSPRSVVRGAGSFSLNAPKVVRLKGDGVFAAAERLQAALRKLVGGQWPLGTAATSEAAITIRIDAGLVPRPQGYRLEIQPDKIDIVAGDAAGAFYGASTLIQMLRQVATALPCLLIEDYPDFPARGVMLDVSRDKVPTLETLFGLVDMLAEWKINHLELYTEHTFAYENHRDVWAQASPYTAEDIRRLDAHCRSRFVELVPNQNCFGHLNRWLELPRYRHLAECPNGFELPWRRRASGPFSLNPTHPESLELVTEWFDELLPNFSSSKFNVGCDETWDLGQGVNKDLCAARGTGRVYLDFLLALRKLAQERGKTMHFWGDIIIKYPELVADLPKDMVALCWGYEANHPFEDEAAKFAASGSPFYVCPGTSSWNSFVGRTKNCLENLAHAARAGSRHGAAGYLNTDWGDNGHLQYQPVSYLGCAAGAAYAWCQEEAARLNLARALDLHAFFDRAGVMGQIVMDLGDAYLKTGALPSNSTALFQIVRLGHDDKLPERVSVDSLEQTLAHIETCISRCGNARMQCEDSSIIQRELRNNALMAAHACRKGIAIGSEGIERSEIKNELARELRCILGEHRELWVLRNRIGGLTDSTRVLEQCLSRYVSAAKGDWA